MNCECLAWMVVALIALYLLAGVGMVGMVVWWLGTLPNWRILCGTWVIALLWPVVALVLLAAMVFLWWTGNTRPRDRAV